MHLGELERGKNQFCPDFFSSSSAQFADHPLGAPLLGTNAHCRSVNFTFVD